MCVFKYIACYVWFFYVVYGLDFMLKSVVNDCKESEREERRNRGCVDEFVKRMRADVPLEFGHRVGVKRTNSGG